MDVHRCGLFCSAVGTCGLVAVVLAMSGYLLREAQDEFSISLKQIAWSFGFIAMFCCLGCQLVDPGAPMPDPADPAPLDTSDDTQRVRERRLPDGSTWKQKWCLDCLLWRPHRCGHCSMCGRCVLRLDHHCGFMGTCVGERNCRFFAGFLLSTGIGLAFLLVVAFRYMRQLGCFSDMSVWYRGWQPGAILMFFCCCPMPCSSPLIGAPAFMMSGTGYIFMMLSDMDIHSYRGRAVQMDDFCAEFRDLLACRGLGTYCLGPLALKRAAAVDRPVAPTSRICPESAGSVSFGREMGSEEDSSLV